jgi:hypothetical protein
MVIKKDVIAKLRQPTLFLEHINAYKSYFQENIIEKSGEKMLGHIQLSERGLNKLK